MTEASARVIVAFTLTLKAPLASSGVYPPRLQSHFHFILSADHVRVSCPGKWRICLSKFLPVFPYQRTLPLIHSAQSKVLLSQKSGFPQFSSSL